MESEILFTLSHSFEGKPLRKTEILKINGQVCIYSELWVYNSLGHLDHHIKGGPDYVLTDEARQLLIKVLQGEQVEKKEIAL